MIRTKINTILQFICEIQGSQFFATETMLVPCFYLHIQGWREKQENALFKKNNKWQPYKLLQSGLTKLADRKKKSEKNKIK